MGLGSGMCLKMLKMSFSALKIFHDNIWKMTLTDPPPLTYGSFHMFRCFYFSKASLRVTVTREPVFGVILTYLVLCLTYRD